MKSPSQIGQDSWVIEQMAGIDRPKTYLEIGACNGYDFSNTYLLEQEHGWTGLLVEPHPELFDQLKVNRTQSKVSNALIDYKVHEVEFWKRIGWISGIVDVDTDQGQARNLQHRRTGYQRHQISKRKTQRLETVLAAHDMPQVIDYFSLDVEGAEHRVLTATALVEYRFNLLTVERPKPQLEALLEQRGYIELAKTPHLDTFYRHMDFPLHPKGS